MADIKYNEIYTKNEELNRIQLQLSNSISELSNAILKNQIKTETKEVISAKHKAGHFDIAPISNKTLTVSSSSVPDFYNIETLSGDDVKGVLEKSSVSNIARLVSIMKGYVCLTWEDEVELVSSNAGSGSDGEFVWAITQYDKNNTDLRSWLGEHIISDPILTSYKFPFSKTTGITPVDAGDYFTFNFAFNINQNNRRVVFNLPEDNPGLDERIEAIHFPIEKIKVVV